jgi:acetyl esterase/lipase
MRRNAGQRLIVWIAICLIWSAAWNVAQAEEYRYPYRDPYLATATAAILNADGQTPRPRRLVVHVPGLSGRNELATLEGRGNLSIACYRQGHPAPLLFILAGIGSNAYFGLGTYFARLFHQQGFHVVIMPSPMSWNFALAASRSGAPGFAPDDARDLYDAMQRTLRVLKTSYHVEPTRIALMGASLGALEGAYLSVIDAEKQQIGIDTYLLVNPPLDLNFALKTVDEWNALAAKFGRDGSRRLVGRALAIVDAFSTEDRDDPAVFEHFATELAAFTTEEIQFLLAKALQLALPELVYVTQVIHDPAHRPADMKAARRRIEAANRVTFVDYAERMALPLWTEDGVQGRADLEVFARRGSLATILDRLRGNSRVHIAHNADDPLTDRQSLLELKKALGNQVTVFPYGGHLGNLWYPDNKEFVLRILGATSNSAQEHPGVR